MYETLDYWFRDKLNFDFLEEGLGIVLPPQFFFLSGFSFTGQQGKGETISLTLIYHFHPFHRHISRANQPLVSERKSLTTKLRTLILSMIFQEKKCISCCILLTDPIPLHDWMCFLSYWSICVLKFFINQVGTS